jgi:endoglycosylceramidase
MQRRRCGLVVAALVSFTAPALASSPLHVDGRWIRDGAGAAVILRGVNTAGNAKVPPFRPPSDPGVFDPLAGWGMNVVRLLFTWEAYEPSPGVYDDSYLDDYAAAVDAAHSRGLYVIVDFHQDGFSRYALTGCGEGFPTWTIPWWVIKSTPDNSARCSGWGALMIFDIGTHIAWASFHGDAIGARTRYLKMIERVATRLVGHDAVIGYDLMNEPWGDEATELHRLYEDAAVALRHADPTTILFVSPHALISAGGRSNLVKPSFGNFVFSPHYYDPGVVTFGSWGGGKPDSAFANMSGVASAWGVPFFVGEFGAAAATQNVTAYLASVYDGLDAALVGGAQWVYTPAWTPAGKDGWNGEDMSLAEGTGATRANFVARAFPRRVAGTPTYFFQDGVARDVELIWDHAPQAGTTELYVPVQALFGANPWVIDTGGDQLSCLAQADLVRCDSPVAGPKVVHVHAAP